jgi:hypothetical protein
MYSMDLELERRWERIYSQVLALDLEERMRTEGQQHDGAINGDFERHCVLHHAPLCSVEGWFAVYR